MGNSGKWWLVGVGIAYLLNAHQDAEAGQKTIPVDDGVPVFTMTVGTTNITSFWSIQPISTFPGESVPAPVNVLDWNQINQIIYIPNTIR